jgi:hypothetical protein
MTDGFSIHWRKEQTITQGNVAANDGSKLGKWFVKGEEGKMCRHFVGVSSLFSWLFCFNWVGWGCLGTRKLYWIWSVCIGWPGGSMRAT